MTKQELLARLRLHEDSFVEFKSEGDRTWKKTIVAFANSVPDDRVAHVVIGTLDSGEVQGLGNTDKLQKTVQEFCADTCYPSISFTTEVHELDGKAVLVVSVPPSRKRPHFADAAYVREGSRTIRANERQFQDLITGRTSVAAELLRYRGQTVTVATAKAAPGFPEYSVTKYGTNYSRFRTFDCQVLEVNSFFARFLQDDTRFSEPLRNIEISYDEKQHRPLIIVHLDGA